MLFVADYHKLQVQIETEHCSIPVDERTRMQPELDRLGDAVAEFPNSELYLKLVYHPDSEIYHAQAKLKLPGQTIITGRHSRWLDDALMRMLAKVFRRVEHYKEHPDSQAMVQAQRRARLSENIVAPTAADAGAVGEAFQRQDYAAFRRALASHESWVRDSVGRWIQRYPEVQLLLGEAFNTDDLVEEVFLLAFERYGERPDDVEISQWLHDLVEPAVRSLWHEPEEREAASYARTLASKPR
jgi:ribosome-associated translation inhibitor RaiA